MSLTEIQIDTINGSVDSIPAIPREAIAVAGYITGPSSTMWTTEHWADFPLAGKVHIDQSPDLSLFANRHGDVADIENSAATIQAFISAALQRRKGNWSSDAYISFGNLGTLRTAVSEARLTQYVGYWVANWDLDLGSATTLLLSDPTLKAVQFASPTSNPNTLLPGSNLTLATTNCDLSVKRAEWFPSTFPAGLAWRE